MSGILFAGCDTARTLLDVAPLAAGRRVTNPTMIHSADGGPALSAGSAMLTR